MALLTSGAGYAHAAKTIWADDESSLALYGDIRFRHETDNEVREGKPDRNRDRDRLRLRLGLDYKANEVVSLGARLATEANDDHSTNHNFGLVKGGGSEAGFGLDKGFIKVGLEPVWLWAGKNSMGVWDATGLLWDPDLNPEGIAVGGAFGEGYKASLSAGYYIVNETLYDDKDDTMLAWQALVEYGKEYSVKAAVGGFSVNDRTTSEGEDGFPVAGGTADYMHALVELAAKDWPLSPSVGAQLVSSNVDVDKYIGAGGEDSDRNATVVYIKVKPGPVDVKVSLWDVGYAGATALGEFNADEFAKTSNFTGWIVSVKGNIYKALSVQAKYFHQEVKNNAIDPPFAGDAQLGKGNKRTRMQLNFVVKF